MTAERADRIFETFDHMFDLRGQLEGIVRARFATHHDLVGHDVARAAALDGAEVGSRLVVDPSQAHRGDRFGGYLDRREAALGRHSGVRLEAADGETQAVRTGAAHKQVAGRVAVEDQPLTRTQQAKVEIARALQADFFAYREDDVYRSVRNFLLAQLMKHFADDCASRLVVAAKHGAAVGADNVAVDHRLHAFTRNDGVHVRAQKQRRDVLARGVEMADQVAAVAAYPFGGAVELTAKSRAFEFAQEPERNVAFAAGERVDLDDFEKELF